jgi:hypothetical protein
MRDRNEIEAEVREIFKDATNVEQLLTRIFAYTEALPEDEREYAQDYVSELRAIKEKEFHDRFTN